MTGIEKLHYWCKRTPSRKVSFTSPGGLWRCSVSVNDMKVAEQSARTKEEAAEWAVGSMRLNGIIVL